MFLVQFKLMIKKSTEIGNSIVGKSISFNTKINSGHMNNFKYETSWCYETWKFITATV